MKEETDNQIIRTIKKTTVNHVKTFKLNGKDFHNKSRRVDLHHFCRGGRDDTAGNLDPYELFSRENHDRMKSIFNPKAIDHTSLKLISKLRNKKKHK